MNSKIISGAIVVLAAIIGGYVFSVSRRLTGEFTTLGLDVVCALWASTVALFVIGAFRWMRARREERRSFLQVLSMVVPAITLSAWAWLSLSGRVISYGAMMATK